MCVDKMARKSQKNGYATKILLGLNVSWNNKKYVVVSCKYGQGCFVISCLAGSNPLDAKEKLKLILKFCVIPTYVN